MSLSRASLAIPVAIAMLLAVVCPASAGTVVVSGHLGFVDRGDVSAPQRESLVELRTGSSTVLASAGTDLDGNYTFPSVTITAGTLVYVRCYTYMDYGYDNLISVISPGGGELANAYHADTPSQAVADGSFSMNPYDVPSSSTNIKAWWIKDDMTKAYNTPRTPTNGLDYTGRHVAEWSPTSTATTGYSPGGHMILRDTDPDSAHIVLHAMGHSVMYNIHGSLPDTPNCRGRDVKAASTASHAWTEGWADAWALWMTNDPNLVVAGVTGAVDIETSTWGTPGWVDGDTVEGRVAGAIWDITDSANDGTDIYTGYWSDVWKVMRSRSCATFSDFWDQWKSQVYEKHGPVASIYQNSIDYDTAPTLSAMPDISTNEDTPKLNAIGLNSRAYDPETPDAQLTYTLAPTNDPCGAYVSSGYVHLNPTTDWNGTSTMTITCSDGCKEATQTFTVTVNPVADKPKLPVVLPDITINEDEPLDEAIDLHAHFQDPDTGNPANLTYTITGNTNANCGAEVVGNRYINIHPTADWYGYSNVTVKAVNNAAPTLYLQDTFKITVISQPEPIKIEDVPDGSTEEDTPLTGAIDLWAFTSGDIPDSQLIYTIVDPQPDPNLGISITSNQYIDISPAANRYGTSEVTVRASNSAGDQYDEDTFTITVTPVNDPPVFADVPDALVAANATTAQALDLSLYASDPETGPAALTYTVVSGSIPECEVSIDAEYYLKVVPTTDWTGATDVVVRVADPDLLAGESTLSVVVAYPFGTITEARANDDGTWVSVADKASTGPVPGGGFYIQETNRTAGIKVNSTKMAARDHLVTVAGPLSTHSGERWIDASYVEQGAALPASVRPLGMANARLGGVGVYNLGLLVRTTGKVKAQGTGGQFYITDGSIAGDPDSPDAWLLVDGTPSGQMPDVGRTVGVTGISGADTTGGPTISVLRPRDDNDVTTYIKAAFFYDTNLADAQSFKDALAGAVTTDLIQPNQLPAADLSSYQIILIGNDTDASWSEQTRVNAIATKELPVIAIGKGGARFLDRVMDPNLYIGYDHSYEYDYQTQATVFADLARYYPGATEGETLDIYRADISVRANCLYDNTGVTDRLLRQYGSQVCFVLAKEKDHAFYQWGFQGAPSMMTQTGRDLFKGLVIGIGLGR